MNIYLFGSTTLSGKAFINFNKNKFDKIYPFSRRKSVSKYYIDLKSPESFSLVDNQHYVIVSFVPIWDLSDFLKYILDFNKDKLKNLKGIYACSSTSAQTKRFESNLFDKNLSIKLLDSENKLIKIAEELGISCHIIRPTLIYGSIDNYKDKNISKILKIMRTLRIIMIPDTSGLRQPIHANQLVEVIYYLLKKSYEENKTNRNIISVGGDIILNYKDMIEKLKGSLYENDKAKNCLILIIPNRLFFILILPMMIFSPKIFASLCRICSDLSGFEKACEITKSIPKDFPIS
tara:strand:- start:1982 stop:2854 length:873 start_codon:yes stop_codon:yes gene_type:complete